MKKRPLCLPVLLLLLVLSSCGGGETEKKEGIQPVHYHGQAQGTTYSVKFFPEKGASLQQAAIDALLDSIDGVFSTYATHSVISRFNRGDTAIQVGQDMARVFRLSAEVHEVTGGAFDPTVGPLVEAWGFGPSGEHDSLPGKVLLDSILAFTGWEHVRLDSGKTLRLIKDDPRVQLDFNAIAQGYTVDVIARLLEANGVERYMVELGGETRVGKKKPDGVSWRIGIDRPVDPGEERQLRAILELEQASVATSGNYRKFYVKDGVKYAHTIDPRTGQPAEKRLLSVTVRAPSCARADAYATAFMVMGVKKTRAFLLNRKAMEGYLIYSDTSGRTATYSTPGWKEELEEL